MHPHVCIHEEGKTFRLVKGQSPGKVPKTSVDTFCTSELLLSCPCGVINTSHRLFLGLSQFFSEDGAEL